MSADGREAIGESWDCWLSQHPVTVSEIIQTAVTDAVRGWLDDNRDSVIAAVQSAAASAAAGEEET